MYAKLGAEMVGKSPEFRWPSGALFRTGHLKDDQAYTKYQGHEYQRMLIEELTQIPEEKSYLRLLSSCRSTIKELRPQIFCTTNPGEVGHCVSYGDVLTPNGWREISETQIGDYVATDADGETKFVRVEQKIIEYYKGEMIVSSNWSARFDCTPEHKIPIVTETKNKDGRVYHKPRLRKVKDLKKVTRLPKIGKWKGYRIGDFMVEDIEKRVKRIPQPLVIDGDDYCELMGWFLSEGFTMRKLGYFGISQSKPQHKKRINSLLNRCEFHYKWNGASVYIYSRSWADYFSVFGKCRDKFIPHILREAPPDQLKIFWKAAMYGDGCRSSYYTISKQLADDMCDIGLKMGKRVYMSSRQRKNRRGLSYAVSFKENKLGWIEKDKIKTKKFAGHVYCLGIRDYHTFYLRQNGTVYLSGNSWVKNRFVDPAPANTPHKDAKRGRIFIPSTVDDNPTLIENDPQYVETLEALKKVDYDTYMAWRYGDWDRFAGQVFEEFRRDKHVIRRLVPKASVSHFLSFDWGYSAPFAAYAHALVPMKSEGGDVFHRIVTYQEWYGTKKHPDEWAREVFKTARHRVFRKGYADSSMFNIGSDGSVSISDLMRREWRKLNKDRLWLAMERGTRNRMSRVAATHNWLSIAPDGRPYWLITEDCVNLIRTLPLLVYDDNKVEDVDCFVAGTKVRTVNGDVNIEDITRGDLVYTPIGYRKVIKDGISGRAKVVTVLLSNGEVLKGTLNHKVYVVGKGLVELSKLQQCDILHTKTICTLKSLFTRILNTGVIRIEGITNRMERTCQKDTPLFIDRYILIHTVKFLKAIIYIIKIMISMIIVSRTLKWLVLQIMLGITSIIEKMFRRRLKSGGIVPKVKQRLEIMLVKCTNEHLLHGSRADIVQSLLEQNTQHKNTVIQYVKVKMSKLKSVLFAIKRKHGKTPLVHISAVGNIEEEKVYNLTVEDAHLYFANEVLVANTTQEDHAWDGSTYYLSSAKFITGPIGAFKFRKYRPMVAREITPKGEKALDIDLFATARADKDRDWRSI